MKKNHISGSSIASASCSVSGDSTKLKVWHKAMKRYRDGLLKDLNLLLGRKKTDMELINLLVVEISKTNKIVKPCKE